MSDPNTPVATIVPAEQEVVVGAIAKLDGRLSLDPNNLSLTYSWTFTQVPIGSQVDSFGFTNLEDDSSIVSFAPDLSGTYRIRLVVSNGTQNSDGTESIIDVRIILVPNHQGFVPDASFIWNYLSDFWNLVPDKKRFEVVWSSMIQIVSSELLKLYQYQYNQSIRDIQETIQKRWLNFSSSLELDRSLCSFVLSDETAGILASTFVIDPLTGLSLSQQPTYSNVITIPKTEGDFTKTKFGSPTTLGRLLVLGKRTFTSTRSNATFISLDSNSNGSTSGLNVFSGTGFSSNMVGATLRILGTGTLPLSGDYIISTYTSPTQISISNPPAGVTWAGSTGVSYTVLPSPANHTSFFADRDQVPAGTDNQRWRMSSVLLSTQYNFDAQGVSIGDLMEIEILRTDLQVLSTFFVQVTGVDRNRLSFVFNLKDLIDGTVADGLTSDIQITLATDLIVSGLAADINGNLTYALDAATINTTINSTKFKRTYFEKILTVDDEIDVGVFTVKARPVRIIRNKKIAIDPLIVSIPLLQEYIKQPNIIQDSGKIFSVSDDVRTEIPRTPYLLAENLDFIVDDESSIFGVCQTQQGNDTVTIPLGDLIDRSVAEGDTLEITQGTATELFDVRRVLSATSLRVSPIPAITSTASSFTLSRRLPGKFIRFINSVFSKTAPAPDRLWSEVTYFDNGSAIEGNFGVLVGVRREDLQKVGSGISYRNAVAGLMYALSRGPSISNLGLAGHILLGLPFAQTAGIIKEINPEFRVRDDGSPLFGRILVSGIDKNNSLTGITNIYFYPQGRQIFDSPSGKWIPALPDSSGLDINPDTGLEYAVGDTVSQFAPLSKGVAIREYLATPNLFDNLIAQGNIASQLQKYHAFQIVVNSDIIASVDVDLVAQFLKKAKAHYVRLTSALLKSLEDIVDIEDLLSFTRQINFFESPGLGLPTGVKLGDDDYSDSFVSFDGVFYSRYHSGVDLVSTQGSNTVQSSAGGFITARTSFNEAWDPPLIQQGDVLEIISGHNAGKYQITSVISDVSLQLSLGSQVFETLIQQEFRIFRPIMNPIWKGTVSVTSGNPVVSPTTIGIGSAGVSVGDLLVFADLSTLNSTVSRVYTILSVTPDLVSPQITVTPNPSESTRTYSAWIVRNGLLTSGQITPPGSSGELFYVAGTSGSGYLNFTDTGSHINSWLNTALMTPGSRITVDNIPYTVIRYEPGARRAAVTPPLLATYSDKLAIVDLRPARPITPASVSLLDRIPTDYLKLALVSSITTGDLVQTSATSTDTVLTVQHFSTFGIRPSSDYLQLLTGADSVRDVGYGPGIFPIVQLVGDVVRLLDQMTVSGTFRYGILRKVPNEG